MTKMAEERLMIPSEGILLEARWEKGAGGHTVILCHPHPLYSGSMDNNVVEAVQGAFSRMGWGTLRFNFRGVGRSGGSHTHGRGETLDLLGVASHLSTKTKGLIHLTGYSYGAWIALQAVSQGLEPASLILISPPLNLIDFGKLRFPSCPVLVAAGDEDEFCSTDTLRSWFDVVGKNHEMAELQILPGCDHFYWGLERRLTDRLLKFLGRYFCADDAGRNPTSGR